MKLASNQGTNTLRLNNAGNASGDIEASTLNNGVHIYTTLNPPPQPELTEVLPMTVLERLEAAYQAGEAMPVLSPAEFEALVLEVTASELGDYEKDQVINAYLYKGQGFGIDSNL